jgi:MoxR-like ATPase
LNEINNNDASPDISTLGDKHQVKEVQEVRRRLEAEIAKVIVGQQAIIEQMLISLFSGGHALLIGVPGLAKTSIVRTFSRILNLSFKRIQFTPDLMPSDITGTEIVQRDPNTGEREFRFVAGPLFANIVLADEINRTPPKTQAALLEAMQEHSVTSNGVEHRLEEPFFVLATQNPIEQEGTYPLPEAQLDRFMFSLYLDYPPREDEIRIVKETTSAYAPQLEPVLSAEEILSIQALVRRVPISSELVEMAVDLCKTTRPGEDNGSDDSDLKQYINRYVSWGVGPRAPQYMVIGAKARSILEGRESVAREDLLAMVYPVLRHRMITNFHAEADGIDSKTIISELVKAFI